MEWAELLKIMTMEEETAKAKYAMAAAMTDDPHMKEVFERLEYEEEIHADLLRNEYERWLKQKEKTEAAE
ncbi:MAG TPA: hypothetical protein EYP04_07935 [Anaerolineae bacterium]|nr:hypothetical protein [Anaerolineae bacterium]HIQ04459.1 hypothetical protein [Anaerolineae bacterium]